MDEEPAEPLTAAQKKRILKNKNRALLLKKSKLTAHPYSKDNVISIDKNLIKIGTTKFLDTGGGFLLEETPDKTEKIVPIEQKAPIVQQDRPKCDKCNETFANSWLFDTFDFRICDTCKDPEEHKLITRTEAMNTYILKDCDIDKRDPPLKFISRANPHNVRWGEMKLYLQAQVEVRAMEVWGSEEKLQEEIKSREEKRIIAKTKKYQKQMKELRMNVRSSLYNKTSAAHVHKFDSEVYNENSDDYSHTCKTCGYSETFEKM